MTRVSQLAWIKQRCRDLRASLLESRSVSEEELAPYWPGGAENPEKGLRGWIYCYGVIGRFNGRAEARHERGSASTTRDVLALIKGEPRAVQLFHPLLIDGAVTHEVRIGFKSFSALWALAVLARATTEIGHMLAALHVAGRSLELVVDAQTWRDRLLRQLVWGAINDPLPWNPKTTPFPDLPAYMDEMAVADVLQVHHAFADLHAHALLAIAPFIEPATDSDPLSGWHTFFASYATEHGLDADALMQRSPFAPLFAQLSLASHSAREATKKHEAAK